MCRVLCRKRDLGFVCEMPRDAYQTLWLGVCKIGTMGPIATLEILMALALDALPDLIPSRSEIS